MVAPDTRSVVDWLTDGARSAPEPGQVLAEICTRLTACGIPLWRVAVFVQTLHPDTVGRRFLWRPGAPVEISTLSYAGLASEEFFQSPVKRVYDTGAAIRRRVCDPGCPDDFPILAEFRAEGITDYLASPLVFTDGAVQVVTNTTRQPGGFTDGEIAGLEAIMAPLARVTEIRSIRRLIGNLLDTYVGHHAGERILAGRIRRGDTEAIDAAIWLSDMRRFTTLADHLPPALLIGLLNRYFDCQVPAILQQGGQVLKFMGDGLLAIFPLDGGAPEEVCAHALAAALTARDEVRALSESHGIAGMGDLRFGLALHLGEVLYGNIGGGNRLDFTCIGPAVNLTARLEKLAGRLGRTILASADFAARCGPGLVPVGEFTLAGVAAAQTVFGRADEAG
ncbi:MAG TPA: adenylate/guanylate cyclase domain-containing protein [Stellaceae bacterium]|nr:adenylate/guanylate cyclase domain-containing protein [Stellaceae bacterium]